MTTGDVQKHGSSAQGINPLPLAEVPPALKLGQDDKLYPDGRESAYKSPYERTRNPRRVVKDTG